MGGDIDSVEPVFDESGMWIATGMPLARKILESDRTERLARERVQLWVDSYISVCPDPDHPRAQYSGPSLRELIDLCELQQKDIAEKSGYSRSTVSGWLKNEQSLKSDTFCDLCHSINELADDASKGTFAIMCLCGVAEETPMAMRERLDEIKRKQIRAISCMLHGTALDALYAVASSLMQADRSYPEERDGDNLAHEAFSVIEMDEMFRHMKPIPVREN